MILEDEEYSRPEHLPVELINPEALASRNSQNVNINIPLGGINIEDVERELIAQALGMTKEIREERQDI